MFTPGGCREQYVRHFRRFGHEDVLNHDKIERIKTAAHQPEIGLRLQRIFPHDVVGLDLAFQRQVRHFGDARPDPIVHRRNVNPPGVGELLPNGRIGDVLIAGEHIGQHAHITGPLDIVLTAHRSDADGRATEITGQQRQACEPFDHINGLPKLGDAHPPHHGSGRGRREGTHRLTHLTGGEAGEMFHTLWRIVFYRLPVGLKPFCKACNVVFVVQLLFQQHVAKGVHQRHVAAVFELQMLIGNSRRFNAPRIADDNFCAVFTRFQHAPGDDRVGVCAVIAKHQQTF